MPTPAWLRGPVAGVPPLLQPVAHSLLDAREDVEDVVPALTPVQLVHRPGGAASVAFHVRHAAGSIDRLLTYARGAALTDTQLATLAAEKDAGGDASAVVALFDATVDRALAQVRETDPAILLDPREVGRGRLPSTVLGLLVHAAEHTQRHMGQMITTAKVARGALGLALAAAALGACTVTRSADEASTQRSAPPYQAISLLGDTLRAFPLSDATRARYEQDLAAARRAYERAPANADSIVWLGRRLAYLGRIREAIDTYTRGIALHPQDPWLYRHRGHRYITVRELDRAIEDLGRAAQLVDGRPDEVEPDGQPNAQGRPIGTLKSNIWYHLGLAHYLKGDFAAAVPIYRREMDEATNDDRRVSTAHWLYMSLRRLGRDAEAADVLARIPARMDVIENETYHRLLLLYKGEMPADSVLRLDASGEMSVTDATAAYGIGNWHLYNGRPAEARRIFERIVAAGQWGAFGYIAAEAELAAQAGLGRSRRSP